MPGVNPVQLRTVPTYPVPGKQFRVFAESAHHLGTHARIWCSAAPPGTKLRKQLDETRAGKVIFQPLVRLNTESEPSGFDMTLEKGGGYVLQIDEVLVGTGFSGGYEADTRSAPSESIKTSRTATLFVSSPLTMQLGCGQDTATLKLFVHNSTVVQTELAVHGETTPRVDVAPSASSRAKLAAENTNFRAALAALAGQTATYLIGDLPGSLDNLIGVFAAHLTQSGRHYADDADNAIASSFYGATTPEARAAALSELRKLLTRHMKNDNGTGTGAAGYHSAADWENLPLDQASPADALRDAVAHADAWRAYEAHRLSAVHKKTDTTNAAWGLSPLVDLHRLFLAALAATTPDTPATSSTAATLLISQFGFKDA